jgi:hypothetical protein
MDDEARVRLEKYQIPRFRKRYFLPLNGATPIVPLVFVILDHDHFFTVVMDHGNSRVFILGRSNRESEDRDWSNWNGPSIYLHICLLHGWSVPSDITNIKIRAVSWMGNGYDCGPVCIGVVLDLFGHGLEDDSLDSIKQVASSCCHLMRLRIYQDLKVTLLGIYKYFKSFVQNPPDEWTSWNAAGGEESHYSVSDELVHLVTNMVGANNDPVVQRLLISASTCPKCNRYACDKRGEASDNVKGGRARDPRTAAGTLGEHNSMFDGGEGGLESDGAGPGERRSGKLRKRPIDWSQVKPIKYSPPIPPQDVPLPQGALWLHHQPFFDQYDDGPTREDLHLYEEPIHDFPFRDPSIEQIKKSFWWLFRDYGYRLLVRFHQMHYLGPPTQIEDHFLPNGLPETYDPRQHFPTIVEKNSSLSRSAYPNIRQAAVKDFVLMGAQEMLHEASNGSSQTAHDLFIRGRMTDGAYICLDLERDSVDPSQISLEPSIDIDSLIWVTRRIQTKLNIQLMLTPTIRRTAPIRKDNHVYFEVLMPPTDEERASRDREWLEISTSLSSCPHTLFAKVAEAVNIYIFFPRMIHRDKRTGRRVTLMPLALQNIFWNKVLLPALKQHSSAQLLPYVDFTVEELEQKTGKSRPDHYTGISRAVPPSVLMNMVDTMDDIIRRDYPGEILHRFGSFFFVLEAKGIKLYTQASLSPDSDPWHLLEQHFPQLDLEYMMDSNYGQLMVDIGVSINPKTSSKDDAVVALFRLDALAASFGAAGFNKGQTHHANTLGRYGSIQATMGTERMRRTHICHRSCYCLFYESTRRKDNQPYMAEDKDGYLFTKAYVEACEAKERIYSDAQKRSYGVRDEYRAGGLGVKTLLKNAKTLV